MSEASGPAADRANAPEVLSRVLDGYLTTQLARVAAQLGIADVLASGPLDSEAVAAAVGADSSRLYRVLRGLALEGVLTEDGAGRFTLTPAGELLRRDVPGSLRELALLRGEVNHHAAERLVEAVQGGPTPFDASYGRSFFDHLEHHPDHGALFHAAMADRSVHEARQVVDAYDFTGSRTVVDVGGGHGVLLGAILRTAPAARGVLVDTPAVVAQARAAWQGSDLDGRVEVVAADFFDALPSGGDRYVLSRILHDWQDDDARRILDACRRAMAGRGRLLVIEALLPERVQDRPAAVRMDLAMLVLFGGRERTEEEYRVMLGRCGFDVRQVLPTRSPLGVSVLEAVPR